MAADADGYSQAEKNIFKGFYGSANCFSTPDNPLSQFFSIIWCFPLLLLDEVICLLYRAIQKEQVRGVICVDMAQQGLFTNSFPWIIAWCCSSQAVPCLSPVVRDSLQHYPTGAAPALGAWTRLPVLQGETPIQVTVVSCTSGILIFMKTNHFGPT